MKKICFPLVALFLFFTVATKPAYAISEEQSVALQKILDDTVRIGDTPGVSAAIIEGDETYYFSSGYANREKELPATETTLYELASVSKAFTGAGILLLEEQGHLSMTDSIQEYLPWLNFHYAGEPVEMEDITLNHFLYHTSGITNERHFQDIPEGNTPNMLLKTVQTLKDATLQFPPGREYNYGTMNYDVLGLVIEEVTGKSYESFVVEEVLQPLGLEQTYLYVEKALLSEEMGQGYRMAFLKNRAYNPPIYAGNKPAGYIISNAEDMAHWLKIQMGLVKDIPENFKRVIAKSHQGDMSVAAVNGMYYGAGWAVNQDKSVIEHDGINPTFSAQVTMFPQEVLAIALLTNSTNTNNPELMASIIRILEGDLTQSYERSATQNLDIILSAVTIIFLILHVIFLLLGLRRKRRDTGKSFPKKKNTVTIVWLLITLLLTILTFVFPMLIGSNWATIFVWQSYNLLATLGSMVLLSGSITWFVWLGNGQKKEVYSNASK